MALIPSSCFRMASDRSRTRRLPAGKEQVVRNLGTFSREWAKGHWCWLLVRRSCHRRADGRLESRKIDTNRCSTSDRKAQNLSICWEETCFFQTWINAYHLSRRSIKTRWSIGSGATSYLALGSRGRGRRYSIGKMDPDISDRSKWCQEHFIWIFTLRLIL
jgi:hypothetical protein